MTYNLPNGRLSPSSVETYRRCGMQFYLSRVMGYRSAPDVSLEVKKSTHEALLEGDLKQKIETGRNLPDGEIVEIFGDSLQKKAPLLDALPEKPDVGKLIDAEVPYFVRIVEKTRKYRESVQPVAVEHELTGQIGDVPILGYLDVRRSGPERIDDLKRLGKSQGPDAAKSHLQLTTYSALTGVRDVALACIIETKEPRFEEATAQVTDGDIQRAEAIYTSAAQGISAGIFPPATLAPQHRWVCSARFCGYWRSDAVDWQTGAACACPFGEKSRAAVFVGATDEEGK